MKLVFLTRHAERADGREDTNAPGHPELSKAGQARARKLARMLKDAGITDIFVTEARRTHETAAPLAKALGLTPKVVPWAERASIAARIESCAGDAVLVVGHVDTVPDAIAALGGPDVSIGGQFDNLFIYAPATKTLTRLRY
jgi:phosphohistidine phosphatase SixA